MGAACFALGLPLALALGTLQLGCGGGGGGSAAAAPPTVAAPSALTYAANPATYTKGTAIAANAPQSTGGAVASYAIAPVLPAGLSLNPTTGVVSGTPTAVSPQTAYTVTAVNAGGSTSCSLLMAVNDVPPAGLSYPTHPAVYTRGAAIAPNVPTVSGGTVTRFTTSPALPAGLAIHLTSGVISGTPTAVVAPATYHVTATNSGGSTTFDLAITVNDLPPGGLSYSSNPAIYTSGASIPANRPASTGGAIVSYDIAPALSAGLAMDPATGVITGVPSAPLASRTYTVTAHNSGGATFCDLTITINAAPPTGLVYSSSAPVYTRGQAIPLNTPTSAGGAVTAYTAAPALPAGLVLDPVSGFLSGTPTALSPATAYTVTASNSGGSTTCVLSITVREAAPTALVYATNPTAYTVNTAIQPNGPSNGGGAITTYAVSPALPVGLSLDPSSGIISGTPTVLTPQATYVVTGSNATGSTTCDFVTAVVPSPIPPPATPAVTAGAYAAAGQTALQASTQDQGTANGTTYVWTLTNGTVTSGQGTPAITFTAGAVGTLTLSVKVSNLGGSATGSGTVTVVGAPLAQLFAQEKLLVGTRALASVADQPNMTYQWTLSGGSAGTILAGGTNVVSYTAGLTPGTYQLSVTVQSPVGGSASATRTLSVVANQFLPDVQTSRQRVGHSVTTLPDGRVLVAAGDERHAASQPSAEVFDPYSRTWTPTGPMAVFRAYHAAVLLPDGRVLVTGGTDPSGSLLNTSEIYDPATNAWTGAPAMNATRQDHTATLLADGQVLVAGGFGLDSGGTAGGYLASAELYDPGTQSWTPISPMNMPRARHTATRLQNGMVLLAAGAKGSNLAGWLNTAELYDPLQQTWTSVGNLATARMDHTATLLPSGKVLVAAGQGSSRDLDDGELFNPATGTWASTANKMAWARYHHAAVLLPSGKVLALGGSRDATMALVDAYDPATNRWTALQAMAMGRSGLIAAALPTGQVLVTGGRAASGTTVSNPELYDPGTDTWSFCGIHNATRFGHTATALADGRLLMAGGSDAKSYMGSTETFDPAAGSWSGAAPLAKGRVYHTASRLADGTVLVVGGMGGPSTDLGSAERYAPATNTWSSAASLGTARENHTATVLPDGRVLVVGGQAGATILASAELYDPAANAWSSAGSLAAARFGHTATLLSNGKVLVAGGGTYATAFSSAELYDPATNTWTAASAMFAPRASHTATLLPDGTVLVLGGSRDSSSGSATAERYTPATNAWSTLASMNAQRYNHAATLLPDGRVLVTGGRTNSFQYDPTAELYDPATQTTTSLPMSVVRSNHTATVIDAAGTVLVLGGDPGSAPEFWKP